MTMGHYNVQATVKLVMLVIQNLVIDNRLDVISGDRVVKDRTSENPVIKM